MYEEFVASFNEDSSSSMTFVRGGVQNASSSTSQSVRLCIFFCIPNPHFTSLVVHFESHTTFNVTHSNRAGRSIQDG